VQRYSLVSDFFYFYLFFFSGALISDFLLNPETRGKIFNNANFILALPLFVIGQWFWFTHMEKTGPIELLFIGINFIGCYVLFMTAMNLAQSGRAEWLGYIGRYSLYVYILHVQTAAIVRKLVRGTYHDIDAWLLLAICFVCAIVFPIVLVNSFRKYGIERLFTLQKRGEA
jgi:peptidoglycan/LPS O-acetylase OafA/YrhL